MPSGTVIADLPVPPQEAWDVLADLESAPAWVPDLVSVKLSGSGPLGVGSQLDQVMNVQGRTMEVRVTIRQFDPPRVIAHVGEGKSVKISGRTTITETPNGCQVTNEWNLELSGLLKLAAPLAGNWTRSNIEQSMRALRIRLENKG